MNIDIFLMATLTIMTILVFGALTNENNKTKKRKKIR